MAFVSSSTLVDAALSALVGHCVTTSDKTPSLFSHQRASLRKLHSFTLQQPVEDVTSLEDTIKSKNGFHIVVSSLADKAHVLYVDPQVTIEELKVLLEENEGIPSGILQLVSSGSILDNSKTLEECGLSGMSVVHMSIDFEATTFEKVLNLPAVCLDKKYNYDFTNVKDNGAVYFRGSEVYSRPYGWYRYALKVLGEYEDDIWLGEQGMRKEASEDEWPVSYHGTAKANGRSIAQHGYKLSNCKRSAYGKGIYTSPDLDTAASFAQGFTHEGKKYKVVFQNRVNPRSLRKLKNTDWDQTHKGTGEFWLTGKEHDVRPYGILVKET